MPKANTPKKPKAAPVPPVQPVAPAPPPQPILLPPSPGPGLPVVYDKMTITEYSTTSERGPLTVDDMKLILGWETEKEFQKRKVSEFSGTRPEAWVFGDIYHCKTLDGEKVRCNNNAQNRPFDQGWCDGLVHTILYGAWAGPFTIPGETVNGETIRISRYGRVLTGQHQGTALILAKEWLHKARRDRIDDPEDPKYPVWAKHGEPFLETIVITGVSEDPRILMTIDYVKPRTVADVFYTSEVFRESTPPERKELCKLLAAAVDMLWTRTDAKGYRTHPEVVGFLERHRRLLQCVEHLYTENSAASGDRRISKLRLSPGHCAALLYIMGSGGPKTEGDFYRNENPPSEKNLDWSYWDRAEEFWTLLASGKDFQSVRMALGNLTDSTPTNDGNQGLGGRLPEKLALLASAWEVWREHPPSAGPPFSPDDEKPGGCLCLSYSDLDDKGKRLPDGQIKLVNVADFYGIDCPESVGSGPTSREPPMPPAPPPDFWDGPRGEDGKLTTVGGLKAEAEERRKQTQKK